ncbi:MAG TPA: hypothetical protein VKV15_22435 [Bryobacteraceae bacterium]|nr:hypothetical protein [Bryobacteraceae bacterium]
MAAKKQIPVWFFIGVLLSIYGVLILGAGLDELASPPERVVVLENLHVAIWWGAFILVLGAVYVWAFRPGER